ncbi:MAG: flagellar filament capping protein FliD [Gammaproteobacteria bacterium]|nr:flagellar filament capping protein FliD [Gammaproteobacteria bacterium]MBU1415462.1 flagellar filament capping protein FliD [Gammaproteobacteria bacterium]
MAVSTTTVLDVPALVSQLMAIERQPIDKLEAKITDYESKISSFGTLKSLVSTLQSSLTTLSSKFSAYSATSSDTNVFSASADSNAVSGNYTLAVTSLARAQSLVAVGQTSSTTAITAGASTVTFVVGGTTTDVTIGAGASLEDIRSAINAADVGVSATIVNDGSGAPFRLALAATETGAGNAVSSITIQSGGDSTLNGLLAYNPTSNPPGTATLTQAVAAADAAFTVNGIAITSASNTVTDAIQGVTLTLKTTTTSATLNVARDTEGIVDAASTFIEDYNALVSQLKSRSAYASATETTPVLAGDGTVRLMLDQLRSIFSTAATGGTLSYLAEVGISVQSDSSLKMDSATLTNAMANDFSDVTNLFTSASGFTTRLDSWATSVLQTDGVIDVRVGTLNDSIDNYNEQIDRLEARMAAIEQQYTISYTNLNVLLASMDNLSTYLTSQFSSNSNTN